MSARPKPQGWCPSAYRPMVSGDGLICRVKPRLGRLTRAQILGICTAARDFGNGVIDLTSRANLQIRGVSDHSALLETLHALGLLDDSPQDEARRNILVAPDGRETDLSARLYAALESALPDLPHLPEKFGFVIDAGQRPLLQDVSGDVRLECLNDQVLLRADGSDQGRCLREAEVLPALKDLLDWFIASGGRESGRMARHLAQTDLPDRFIGCAKPTPGQRPRPGENRYGLRFGHTTADDLETLMERSGARAVRVTPWRLLILEDAKPLRHDGFVQDPNDPICRVFACSGAPACARAHAPTRDLAERLARRLPDQTVMHISGCAKGCAHPKKADVTLVGTERGFDLVEDGLPWDEPIRTGLTPDAIETLITG